MRALRSIPVWILLLAATAQAGSIRLRPSSTAEAGQPVRLADVAVLEGADAERTRDTIIIADPSSKLAGRAWLIVSIADVRRALEASEARLSSLALSGRECVVRFDVAKAVTPERSQEPPPAAGPETVDLGGPPTVRKQIASALASHVGVEPTDLRLLFESADAEFLDAPRHGVEVIAQPRTTSASSRAVLSCRVLDGDRMIDSRTIRADVEVRRLAIVVQENIRRKDEIPPAALAEQEMWMPLSAGRPLGTIDEAEGALARTRLSAGTVLMAEHLETPVVVKKNELVTVHAVRGGIEIQMRARARADARRGEIVQFRGERSTHEFPARVERAGVAVMTDGSADSERAEEP